MSFRIVLLCLALLSPAVPAGAGQPVVLVIGDSLSAAYGMDTAEGWVALLQDRLRERGYGYRVVNASQSGATSDGARALLPRALERHRPDIVIVEIGGNDGLRGLPLRRLRGNIEAMLETATGAGAQVLLTGIRIPPNYGPQYTEQFHRIYHDLAREHGAALVPHLLEGIALDPALMQADGIHPAVAAQPLILDVVWTALEPLLADAPLREAS